MKSVMTPLSYVAVAIVSVAVAAMLFNLQPKASNPESGVPSPEAALIETMNGDDDLDISVLGDSTGDGADEWVALWAMLLAADGASVSVKTWNHDLAEWSEEPEGFGSGRRSITVWNGSVPGATPSYPIGFKNLLQPVEPDIIITSFGHDHDGDPGSLGTEFSNLLDTARHRWDGDVPTLVTIQNPGQGSAALEAAAGQHAIREVARQRDLPVVDINEVFQSVGDVESLMQNKVRPGPEGYMLWAATMDDFFDGNGD